MKSSSFNVSLGMAILLLMGSTGVHAENRWALLVGVSHYDNGYDGLPYCINDVEDLASRLQHKAGFDHVVVMTNNSEDSEQPSSTRVLAELSDLADAIAPDDTFLFYFSGHGASLGKGQDYLCTQDVDRDRLDRTAIPLSKGELSLQTKLGKIRALKKVVILDCCRNNPGKSLDTPMTSSFVEGAKDLVHVSERGGTAVLLACSEGEKAYVLDKKKHSAFTHYLLQGLDTIPGDVTVGVLSSYARARVPGAVKAENQDWEQNPDEDLRGSQILLERNIVPPPYKKPTETFKQVVRALLNGAEDGFRSLRGDDGIICTLKLPYAGQKWSGMIFQATSSMPMECNFKIGPLTEEAYVDLVNRLQQAAPNGYRAEDYTRETEKPNPVVVGEVIVTDNGPDAPFIFITKFASTENDRLYEILVTFRPGRR